MIMHMSPRANKSVEIPPKIVDATSPKSQTKTRHRTSPKSQTMAPRQIHKVIPVSAKPLISDISAKPLTSDRTSPKSQDTSIPPIPKVVPVSAKPLTSGILAKPLTLDIPSPKSQLTQIPPVPKVVPVLSDFSLPIIPKERLTKKVTTYPLDVKSLNKQLIEKAKSQDIRRTVYNYDRPVLQFRAK